jgi:hypothetical protein
MYKVIELGERIIVLVQHGCKYPTRMQYAPFFAYNPYPVAVRGGGHLEPVIIPEHVEWRFKEDHNAR